MSDDIIISAPAKVNIGLKVLHNRSDGFHNIESIFQTVSLCDELKVSLPGGKKTCKVECDSLSLPAENTLTKTYNAFCDLTGFDESVSVFIKKRIPSGGGLGGGSSDAASFLVALSRLGKIKLTDSLADSVASKVGSDVFFFLHSGFFDSGEKRGCALVSGRGEIVKKIKPRDDLTFLLLFPDVHSSTKEAYELLDKAFDSGEDVACPDFAELEKMYYSPLSEWKFANSFTPVLSKKYSLIESAIGFIIRAKAGWAEMSGSGSTVFGVYDSDDAAKAAASRCSKEWKCVLAH